MKFRIVGANKQSGDDVDMQLVASDSKNAEHMAHEKGIMVSSITPVKEEMDLSPIAMIDDPPAAAATPTAAANHAHAAVGHAPAQGAAGHAAGHGPTHTVGTAHKDHGHGPAGNHGGHEAAHGGHAHGGHGAGHADAHGHHTDNHHGHQADGHHHDHAPHPAGHLEYKLMQNQALFLLEKSVNKMILEGWEPIGGLTIAIQNNAPNYFQALIRHPVAEPVETKAAETVSA